MSVLTDSELEYLASQRLGRIATVGADGQPHVVPTSFRYDPDHDAIDVGGMRMSQTKKLRDVQRTGRASIVVDDVQPPWQPRMIEIRGTAEVSPQGGKAFGDAFEDTIVRIRPTRIISFGINPGEQSMTARSVSRQPGRRWNTIERAAQPDHPDPAGDRRPVRGLDGPLGALDWHPLEEHAARFRPRLPAPGPGPRPGRTTLWGAARSPATPGPTFASVIWAYPRAPRP